MARSADSKIVGVVGAGIMGSAMARNLLRAGYSVCGFDPAPAAMTRLKEIGGLTLASPREVIEAAPIVITSLPTVDALMNAVGGDGGLAEAVGSGQIAIECSTLPLEAKQEALAKMEASGKILLDCPVSGTGAQAVNKDLMIFASGNRVAYDRCAEVFSAISRDQRYLGEFGRGSVMKFIANLLVTIHNVAAAEAMVLGVKAGLDPDLIYSTLAESAGTSRMFQVRGPLMRDGSYDKPTATIRMHRKDISVIDQFAASQECVLPLYASATQFYHAGAALGLSGWDTAAVCAVLETMNGIRRGQSKS